LAPTLDVGPNVTARMCRENCLITFKKAIPYVREIIQNDLVPEAFVDTKRQNYKDANNNHIYADVYGIKNKKGVWYVKFYIECDKLIVVSCHEPEFPIKRVDGRTIRPREQ